jgi:hypothetical protein
VKKIYMQRLKQVAKLAGGMQSLGLKKEILP